MEFVPLSAKNEGRIKLHPIVVVTTNLLIKIVAQVVVHIRNLQRFLDALAIAGKGEAIEKNTSSTGRYATEGPNKFGNIIAFKPAVLCED